MSHLLLTILFYVIFYCICPIIGVAFGLFFFGPVLVGVSDKKMKWLILSWVVLLAVLNVARYYTSWFLDDRRPSPSSQITPQLFLVSAMVSSVVGRYRAKRFPKRGK